MKKVHLKPTSNRGVRLINDHGNIWSVVDSKNEYVAILAEDNYSTIIKVKDDKDFIITKEIS